ncbi:MAG: DUF126 domain-containing protein [Candidatus Bathyarchaeia archaeon]
MEILLKGRPIVPGEARGLALVSSKPLSFLGGVDAKTGVIIERGHDLYGVGVKDKILCFPHGRGSTVGSYVLYALAKNGVAPRAIVNSLADPVVVVGAVIANIPMVDCIDISMIKTGDLIEVDGGKGLVRICRK